MIQSRRSSEVIGDDRLLTLEFGKSEFLEQWETWGPLDPKIWGGADIGGPKNFWGEAQLKMAL